jgi:hypothetical protein
MYLNSNMYMSSSRANSARNIHTMSNGNVGYETDDQEADEEYARVGALGDEDEEIDEGLLNCDLDEDDEDDDIFGDNSESISASHVGNNNRMNSSTGPYGNSHLKHYCNSMSTASCIITEVNYLENSQRRQQTDGGMANMTPDTSITTTNSSSSSSVSSPTATSSDHHHHHQQNPYGACMQPPPFLPDSNKFFQGAAYGGSVGKNTRIINSIPNTPTTNKFNSVSRNTINTVGRYQPPQKQLQQKPHSYQPIRNDNLYNEAKVVTADVNSATRIYKFQPSSSSSVSSASSPPSPLPQLPYTTRSTLIYMPSDSVTYKRSDMSMSPSLARFSHFDTQSTFFNAEFVKLIMSTLHNSVNIKTGASAAFASRQPTSRHNFSKHGAQPPQTPTKDEYSSMNHAAGQSKRPKASFTLYSNSNESPVGETDQQADASYFDLVEECPCFRAEVGGDTFRGLGLVQDVSQRRMMKLNSSNILDKCAAHYKKDLCDLIEANSNEPFAIEYQDWGAYFYRYYFVGQEHANYVGSDEKLGPVAVSVRRVKLLSEPLTRSNSSNATTGQSSSSSSSSNSNDRNYDYAYRFLLRTSDVS